MNYNNVLDLKRAILSPPSDPCSVMRKSVFPVIVSSSGNDGSRFSTTVLDPTVLLKSYSTHSFEYKGKSRLTRTWQARLGIEECTVTVLMPFFIIICVNRRGFSMLCREY